MSVIVSAPVRSPTIEGSKNTAMVQLTFGATLLVQPFVQPKSAVASTLVIFSVAASAEFRFLKLCGTFRHFKDS